MREFIEYYDHVFIKLGKDEAEPLRTFNETIPHLIIKNNTYMQFKEYISARCRGHISIISAAMTDSGKICCKLEEYIDSYSIELLKHINLNDFIIYADCNNLYITFTNKLSVEQDNK